MALRPLGAPTDTDRLQIRDQADVVPPYYARITRYLLLTTLVAVVYIAAARLGQALAFSTNQVSAFWPPAGVGLAALRVLGQRTWPGGFVAALWVNAWSNQPLWVACAIAVGNTAAAVIGARVLRALRFNNALERTRDVMSLLAVAIGIATVSATMGTLSLSAGAVVPWPGFLSAWGVWWTGDSLGVLILAPALLTWVDRPRIHWQGARLAEFAIYVALTVLIGLVVFVLPPGASLSYYSRAYVTFPLLAWGALRLRPREAALGLTIVCILAAFGTVHDHGPFGEGQPDARLILMDTFIATLGCTALLIAAVTAERQGAREAARESIADLHQAQARLRQAYEDLEERVRERTAELAAAVAELEQRNQEKETLLREIHHRVKNNLQVVCSLLNLQAHGQQAELVTFAEGCKSRVRSMALVHEHLYRAQNLHSVPLAMYLGALLEEVACTQPAARRVTRDVNVQDIALPVDQAIPCGLIVNELVTNAFKHAFPGDASGRLTVSLQETTADRIELVVSDDGIGMPDDIELQRSDSFGLNLVSMLADQLHGALHIARHPGTRVQLSFSRRRGI